MDKLLKANKLSLKISRKHKLNATYLVDFNRKGQCYKLDKHTGHGVIIIRDNLSLSKAIELLYIILDCIETE